MEAYRRMTPAQRIAEMRALIDLSERALRARGPDDARRCFAVVDRMRAESKEAFLSALESTREALGPQTVR